MDDFTFTYDDFNQIKSGMMQMIYDTLITNVDDAISNSANKNEKLKALNTILLHFEKLEEYEKCGNIKKIIERVKFE